MPPTLALHIDEGTIPLDVEHQQRRLGVQYRKGVNTLDLLMTLFPDGTPEDLSGSSYLGSVSLMWPLEAVELDE